MQRMSLKGVVVGAVVGAMVAAATTALAAVHVFNLEASNSAAAKTSVTGSFNDKLLQLTNNSTGTSATALGLTVPSGRPPLTVSSSAKVTSLNADMVDGYSVQTSPTANTLLPVRAGGQFPNTAIPGKFTAVFQSRKGPLPLDGAFTSSGGNLLVSASGSGLRDSTPGTVGIRVMIDGVTLGVARSYTNEVGSHKAFVMTSAPLTGLAAGAHTLTLALLNLTDTNTGDFFSATVQEIPASIGPSQDFLEPNDGQNQQVAACYEIGPGQSFYANLSTASDNDWFRLPSDCNIPHATIHVLLTGGVVMDVYDNNLPGSPQVATGVTSFDHADPGFAGDDLTMHVRSGSPKQYKFSWSYT